MAERPEIDPSRPPARLYLVAPPAEDASALARELDRALGAEDVAVGVKVAAVLLRLPSAAEPVVIRHVETIAPVVQQKGIALLLEGHAGLVSRTGADGAHLTGIAAFSAAVGGLKPDRIAGAGGLATRHDAMLAAERGADYVMFGEPASGDDNGGGRPPFAAIVDRIAWWAEVFQPPCVGHAESLEDVAALTAAGADFVALGTFVFTDPRGAAAMIRAAAERLSASEPVK